MSEDLRRRVAYFEALARLQPGWEHDSRGHLGAIKIQLDVLDGMLAHETGETVKIEELRPILERAIKAVRPFETAIKLQFGAWRGPDPPSDLLDLAGHVTRLGMLLEPTANDLKIHCSVTGPSAPLWIEGGEPGLREALTIAAVEMLFLGQQRESVALHLQTSGDRASLRIEVPRMPPEDAPWLGVVRETLAKHGGEVRTSGALELDLAIPRAAVPR